MAKDNKTLLIIGLVVLAVLVLGQANLGLFSVTGLSEGYISNEPETIQELIDSGFAEEYNYTVINEEYHSLFVLETYQSSDISYISFKTPSELPISFDTCEEAMGEIENVSEFNKTTEIYGRDIYLANYIMYDYCSRYNKEAYNQCLKEHNETCENLNSEWIDIEVSESLNSCNGMFDEYGIHVHGSLSNCVLSLLWSREAKDYAQINCPGFDEAGIPWGEDFFDVPYLYCDENSLLQGYCKMAPCYCLTANLGCTYECLEWENKSVSKNYVMCNQKNNILITSNNIIHQQNYMDYFIKEGEWYNQELFPIGDFIVKMWMLLAGFGGILLIVYLKK